MKRARTDAELSLQADEFLWSESGLSEAHGYLLPTVLHWLTQAGAHAVLDLGCGNGAFTNELAKSGFSMTGVDVSESGLAIASQNYPDIRFLASDMDTPVPAELQQRFDAVVAIEVIEHLLLPRQLFERAQEALRPGGILVITTPYHGYLKNLTLALTNKFDRHWHPLRDYGHVKFFSRDTLAQLFMEQGIGIERFTRVGRVPVLAKSMIMQGSVSK